MMIQFPHDLNVSVQPTDILYGALTHSGQSGVNNPFAGPPSNTAPIAIGEITSVNHFLRQIEVTLYNDAPTSSHYLFFSKDRRANMSGIAGYFAECEYRNRSKLQTEIFTTAVDYVESSK